MDQLEKASLEDKAYNGDANMASAKNKMLIRDTKKELMRYSMLKNLFIISAYLVDQVDHRL